MFSIKKIDHVAVCVPDIEAALERYEALLGVSASEREASAALGTEAVFFPLGATSLELIAPIGNPSLDRFLEKRGPSLHHVAFEVEGLDAALAFLKAMGVPLLDESPRKGARGHRIAFLHPKATDGVLVELVEAAPNHSSTPEP
jgi:methylmalonyl-CoA/ethylmalonyl-CoA epimerase